VTRPDTTAHEVPLNERLAEFRSAIQSEIEAARRNECNSAVPLINGHRIGQVGGSWQYVFDIENILTLPDGSPGDLRTEGRAPTEVTVLSVVGMTITLSVPIDLGVFVPAAKLQSNLAQLMRKLIERIESSASRANPVGERICGWSPVGGEPEPTGFIDGLNEDQTKAVESSLGRNTTFVWGPPGTGKTKTIGAIAEQLYCRGRSVLLVSHTNAAVDQAVLRIEKSLPRDDLERGCVVRVGDPQDARLKTDQNLLLLKTHVDRRSQALSARRETLKADLKQATERAVELAKVLEMCEWLAEAEVDIAAMSEELDGICILDEWLVAQIRRKEELQQESARWAAALNGARYAVSRKAKILELVPLMEQAGRIVGQSEEGVRSTGRKLAEARQLHQKSVSVGWLTRSWRGLPSPEQQLKVIRTCEHELASCNARLSDARGGLDQLQAKHDGFVSEVQFFFRKYSVTPDEAIQKAEACATQLTELVASVDALAKESRERREQLEVVLTSRLRALNEWGLTEDLPGAAESMLDSLEKACDAAAAKVEGVDLAALKSEREGLNRRIREIEVEIALIEAALEKVEDLVIAEAKVVATTLTRAYLRDSIQARRFDTVILDEASMAPIPALWIAASLADANAVVVGDDQQLPPIVLSEHELARKWLGRDVFEVAGIHDKAHFVPLKTQYRMHPAISAIPRTFFYPLLEDGDLDVEGKPVSLLDDAGDANDEDPFLGWYRADWGFDKPVLLVSTTDLHAWVTSVSRGSRASRLNFLSATVCVDIAEQLLRGDRTPLEDEKAPRILIACPYRPHARLLKLLLTEQGLANEVNAGTAHSFQGSEAGTVILDLVNDEPHFRVGMFVPARDSETKRLLNVALTRAKRRLIVVGDFEYIVKNAPRAFIGAELIPFLRARYPCVDARQVVPHGLAGRAAKVHAMVQGGQVEPTAARMVVTQERFYPLLQRDIARASNRIVVYSPFITSGRLGQIAPQVGAAVERGVSVYVVTKARGDRKKRELATYRMLEETLGGWGVHVVHKRGHEKVVFIDDNVLWAGSLNPLSHSNTQEIMERRASKEVVQDFMKTLCLNELVGEYDGGVPACPICGSEIVASEGRNEPFYWRCVERDCYSRSMDEPRLEGGLITCNNCGGSVEYGEWGGKPHWRCQVNRQHRQRIARTHLRLPRMRELIPPRILRALDLRFGLDAPDAPRPREPGLFD